MHLDISLFPFASSSIFIVCGIQPIPNKNIKEMHKNEGRCLYKLITKFHNNYQDNTHNALNEMAIIISRSSLHTQYHQLCNTIILSRKPTGQYNFQCSLCFNTCTTVRNSTNLQLQMILVYQKMIMVEKIGSLSKIKFTYSVLALSAYTLFHSHRDMHV